MRFRRSFLASALALAVSYVAAAQEAIKFGAYYWPTPNPAFIRTGMMRGVVQPTESGALDSAVFGCIRNDGERFHEGVDLCPVARDKRGEPLDPVFAFDSGIVRYVNRKASLSSYGNYIVIEHPGIGAGVVTLYAHLRTIADGIAPGVSVKGGQKIAIMGHTSGGYRIPQKRAHLHFEVGFWLGKDFQRWYDEQPFDSKNDHGAYNGMNIVGLDVWQLLNELRKGEVHDVWEFVMSEPVAVEAYVRSDKIPELLRVNPHLMENLSLPPRLEGWKVELTWYGLPLRFTALDRKDFPAGKDWLQAKAVRPDLLKDRPCMDLVRSDVFGGAGPKLNSLMRRLYR